MSPFSAQGDDEGAMSLHEPARNLNRHIFCVVRRPASLSTPTRHNSHDERFDIAQIRVQQRPPLATSSPCMDSLPVEILLYRLRNTSRSLISSDQTKLQTDAPGWR